LHADCLKLDGDAALAFEVHLVQELLGHVALSDRSGDLEESIGKGRLSVVNVGDDAKISNSGSIQRYFPSRYKRKLTPWDGAVRHVICHAGPALESRYSLLAVVDSHLILPAVLNSSGAEADSHLWHNQERTPGH
jgi:hypothetical protein